MLLVLETMKDDLEHWKKYLKVESCSCTREWKLTGKELKAILSYFIPPNGHVIIQIGLTLGIQPKDMIMEKEHIFFQMGAWYKIILVTWKLGQLCLTFPQKPKNYC